ncbi:MAG: GNAT family N-acetyltransferase [Paracoccaceae bacterium]
MVDTLRTERLILRPLRASDAGPMTLYAADPRVARMTTSIPHPYPPGAAAAYIERVAERAARERAWAIDATPVGSAELVGVISYKPVTGALGYWVGPPFWNTGYATEALACLVDHLFETEGVDALGASVFADNPASIQVLQKAGFVAAGETMEYAVARGGPARSLAFRLARPAQARAAE